MQRDIEQGGVAVVETWAPSDPAYKEIHQPAHYQVWPGQEAIHIIKEVLTPAEFNGYCKGNILKYRLRAGGKDSVVQDIEKAKKYLEFLEAYIKEEKEV